MLSNNTKSNTSDTSTMDLSFFQRQLFYITLFFLPWFVIPLPWDSTDQIKTTLFILLASLIILLEVVKWIWDGKISILRSKFDKVFLVLLFSFIISTIFSLDKWIAVWGFEGRLSTGLLSMSVLLVFFFLARSFLNKSKQILKSIEILLLGVAILTILSMLSFFKVDIFSWIPYLKHFFIVGLPLTFSLKEILLISGSSIFLSIALIINYLGEHKYQRVLLPFGTLTLGFISIVFFSINQGIVIPILILLGIILTSLLLFVKLEKKFNFFPALLAIFSVLTMVFAVGFQYESFRDSILGSSFEVISPLSLAPDISWKISSGVIVEDFYRGLVGIGNESFSLAYKLFRPATASTISLGNVDLNYASSEIFTTLANRGIIGVIVWILLGVVLLKSLVLDLTENFKDQKSLLVIALEINAIIFFLASLFVPFSFLLYFLFSVSVLLLLILKNVTEKNEEQFLLKFWAVNIGGQSKDINKTITGINWFFTSLLIILTFAGLLSLGSKTLSSLYIVRAEAYSIEESKKYESKQEVTFEQREEFFNRLISYYYKALRYDSSNPIANRKASASALEIMAVLSESYQKASESEKSSILSEISNWKNISIDLSKEAISTSSYTYTNWYNRASIYIGFLSIGLSDYSEDALSALQYCVNLNPLDYESYYRAGQIYMIKEDYEKALSAFNNVLNINGQHVPSLVLSARIFNENGDTKNAISFLEAAKKIMEINKLEEDDMYSSIVDSLKELGANNPELKESSDEKSENSLTNEFEPLEP
ncbi:MAG: tetratricopeptide repeat protein [Candidatus Dojkabacteria bacterium]|nr:tetratricopeptide repeat protein [Candidatus Dojkabacteria bacterium]